MWVWTLVKWVLLGLLNALGILALVTLGFDSQWTLLGILGFGLILTNVVLVLPHAYPLRYILPGLIFFAAFVVYPMLYSVYLSLTNLSTGHLLSKTQVIEQLQGQVLRWEDSQTLSYWAYGNAQGEAILLLLKDKDERWWLASLADRSLQLIDPADARLSDADGDGVFDSVDALERLQGGALAQQMGTFENTIFPYGEDVIRVSSLREFRTYKRQFHYDPQNDQVTQHYRFDEPTQRWMAVEPAKALRADEGQGFFVAEDGTVLTPGWQVWVGWNNYLETFRNPRIVAPFLGVFGWTFVFALLSVLLTFGLGLLLAMLLNDEGMRFRRYYRALLILPWAIPSFISIMVWRGLLNPLGPASSLLDSLFGIAIPWFNDPFWAKVGIILLNLWLGFPYMMTITLGALQGIAGELYEAAFVDGASRWKQFRTITFPLLLVAVGPLLVGSFAYNFNNFNVIFLFTGGGPPIAGAQTPAGSSDILISYTYQVAFNGGWGQQYGFAAAITIGIFLLVGIISAVNFKFTGALEEVSQD